MLGTAISRLELFTNSRHLWDFRQVGRLATITMRRSREDGDGVGGKGECNCNGELITRDIIAFPGSRVRGADSSVRKLRRGDFALRRPTTGLFSPSCEPVPAASCIPLHI